MTIYILSQDHAETAKWLDDKSLDRQIKDISQVLCNVYRTWCDDTYQLFTPEYQFNTDTIPLKRISNDQQFKWFVWARDCKKNYLWLVDLLYQCLIEYRLRISGHKMYKVLCFARDNVPDLPEYFSGRISELPLVMPKKHIGRIVMWTNNIAIELYRNYYQAKLESRFKNKHPCDVTNIKWTRRDIPLWLKLREV